jgi:hypothetical protein
MSDIPFTEVIQSAYSRAKKECLAGRLPVSKLEDLCHTAYLYALIDIYRGKKKPDYQLHYNKPIDQLYELFDGGKLNVSDTYATFAFCYLKIYEIEGLIPRKSLEAQFEHEKTVAM